MLYPQPATSIRPAMAAKSLEARTDILSLCKTVHILGSAGERRQVCWRETLAVPRRTHQRLELHGRKADERRGLLDHRLRRARHGPTGEAQHGAEYREKPAGASYDSAGQLFRLVAQAGIRLAQPHELFHQLALELPAHVRALDPDCGPGVATREQAVVVADVFVFDRKD